MKHEWRKAEKQYYQPKSKPEFIEVPSFKFITIDGEGHPESPEFAKCIEVLYSLSYAVKMNLKKLDSAPTGYVDYTVYPLEGVWDINDEAKANFTGQINKNDFVYTLMIRQPDFVSDTFFNEMKDFTKKKKNLPKLENAKFKSITDGPCIQMMHRGSFDDEPASFEQMEAFALENGYQRQSKIHREIYLSDFRKVPAEKLKTILRFKLKE